MHNTLFGVRAKLAVLSFLAVLCTGILLGGGNAAPGIAAPGIAAPSANSASVVAQGRRTPPFLALQVYFRSEEERRSLALEFGVEEVRTADPFITIWGDEASYNNLLARGLRVEIDDVLTRKASTGANHSTGPDTFFGGYRTVEEVESILEGYAQANPSLAEMVDIGDSWCKSHPGACTLPAAYSGYDLWALHITNRSIPGPKPVFWFDAGIHSREIATPELALRYISLLLDGYETDADAHWLVDYHDIWVIPLLNPDGHHIVESGGDGFPYLHRKNADNDDGCADWPPSNGSQFGIDLNRNFIEKWACCGQSSSDPCSLVYHGPGPGSEDETQAVIQKVRSLIPDQRGPLESDPAPITTTGIMQTIHSYGAVHIYPGSFQPNPVLNAGDMQNMAHHMSAPDAGGTGYDSCDIPGCYAIIDGAAIMWAYGELGVPAFTTEISGGFFFPDYSSVDGIWQENRGSLVYMAKIARTPYLTTRGPDANSLAMSPGVVVPGTTAHISATINSAWQGNIYAENIHSAEYYIDVPPWAGGTAVPLQPSDGAFDELTENVQANINTSGLTIGKHIIFVRGRGISTYEGYASWGPLSAAFLEVVATLPTATPTATASPTSNPTMTPTITASPTSTSTPSYTPTPTVTPILTSTPMPSNTPTTPTMCSINFSDVPPSHTFYAYVHCLACRGVLGGYPDGTFRPGNNITRGQIAKVVSNAAGFSEPVTAQTFADVPADHTFYIWVERLAGRSVMSGYACGQPSEPCDGQNRPYFRPGADASRGQLSKITSNAAGFTEPATAQLYADVPADNPFYQEITRLTVRNVISGYACGGPGEPCDNESKPYFRWANTVTRGQASKITSNTFFPGCVTP